LTSIDITERASDELLKLVDFLAESGVGAANHFLDRFGLLLERLARFPEHGQAATLSDRANEHMAYLPHARMLYRFEGGVVTILRVVHDRSDPSVLAE